MKNLSKLSLKKALSREELRQVKGEGSNCYCQDWNGGWKPGFYLGHSCPSTYPSGVRCIDVS